MSMWITHIKLKWFCREQKLFLRPEKREYIDSEMFYGKTKFVGMVFFIFINFFIKIFINQEHNLLQGSAFRQYVCCENCMSDFSGCVLNLSKSGNIYV